jgi:diguanylate cyclase (GGDEF)-like protein
MDHDPDIAQRLARLEGRVERQRRGRLEAERLLEVKSRELYEANEALRILAVGLEQRIKERTEELVAAHRHALDLTERDPLTGLANRRRFAQAAAEIMAACSANGSSAAFVIVDIDNFKEINDSLGHAAGDCVLRHVADGFRRISRQNDIVARVGGDEFCIILPCARGASVADVVHRFREALQTAAEFEGRPLPVMLSTGYAYFPQHGSTLDEVMRHADLALYTSKNSGRGLCTAFTTQMSADLEARQKLEADLRQALCSGELESWFQPILDTTTKRVCGVESLVRWRRPDGSVTPPSEFLSIAEECGLMHDLFSQVLRASLRNMRPHIERGDLAYVSVNLSPSQFKFDSLARDIALALRDAQFPPEALSLEVTEQVLLTDFDRARHQLSLLVKRGVRVALDDFGNGYANISYLRELPLTKLKLDRSMTADVETDVKARSIVSAIAYLAASLELTLIAEGVETQEQSDLLRLAGCRFQQGYLFARPMPAARMSEFLNDHRLLQRLTI